MKRAGRLRSSLVGLLVLATLGSSRDAAAELPAKRLESVLARLPDHGARFLNTLAGSTRPTSTLIAHTSGTDAALDAGLLPITNHLALVAAPLDRWNETLSRRGVRSLLLPTQRRPLANLASKTLLAGRAHDEWGVQGDGTIVGIVDTGGDPSHPALQHADGTTRVVWMLAFDKEPLGLHPRLEEAYGCHEIEPCAVYSREDIDRILDGTLDVALPQDRIGHGTHIASLAAGRDEAYPGIAPQADLIVVSAATESGGVTDARILLGTKFVFDQAQAESKPAVVNVSLGSNFGAHDGTASVERGLAELAKGPGRALVIASGNSGGLLELDDPNYTGPFGIHTEVSVPRNAQVKVPLLNVPGTAPKTFGTIFVWIATFPDTELSFGFDNGRGARTQLIPPGSAGGLASSDLNDPDNYDVVLFNGVDDDLQADILPGNLVFALAGSWEAGRTFELVLEGQGTARLWVSGPTELGTIVPRARSNGTVAVPGTEPHLITVGATVNRESWEDYQGHLVGTAEKSRGLASFSAAGPNQLGMLKPEVLAPGSGVIGAMARAADPRGELFSISQFSSGGLCPDATECFVIDDEHGLALGTSMAVPFVTGTIALLMQRQPDLTLSEAKHLLMAGTSPVHGRDLPGGVGTGQVNVVGTLLAQDAAAQGHGAEVDPDECSIHWADSLIHPPPGPALLGYLKVRDATRSPVTMSRDDLTVRVTGPGTATWKVVAPGLVELQLSPNKATGGQELSVEISHSGRSLTRSTLPIALDPQLAAGKYAFWGGSCAYTGPGTIGRSPTGTRAPPPWSCLALAASALVWTRRRTKRST